MPVQYQSFSSKRATWRKWERRKHMEPALGTVFAGKDSVRISRNDLFSYARGSDLSPFIMATIIWGYTRGMRGHNLRNMARRFPELVTQLTEVRRRGITDWARHFAAMDIGGVGLSTYTKFLYFLRVSVEGRAALILDARLIEVCRRQYFDELDNLQGLTAYNAMQRYPQYLARLQSSANELKVSVDALEMFLFEFGLNLKPPAGKVGQAPTLPLRVAVPRLDDAARAPADDIGGRKRKRR